MGTPVPAEPRWAPDTPPAEQVLFRWAVEQLDDRVLVLPQVAMSVGSGGRLEEAEADLVLIDPEHGVTVVEVKGGTLSYDARQALWRRREAGSAPVRDPVLQAKRTRTVVRGALESVGIDTSTVALRWAVATPECRVEAPGPPVLDAAGLWDSVAADQLATLHRRTCGPLVTGEQPLGPRAERVAAVLRGRSREGRPTLAVALDEHEEQVRVHTESHRNVLRRFAAHPHVLVRGAAGTGKTVLAIEAAAQLAALGERVLLVCWNIVLARWLRTALADQLRAAGSPVAAEVTADPGGRVVVTHLAELAGHAVEGGPEGDLQEWFHDTLPSELHAGVTGGEFDAVVLDEGQDLSELWVLALSGLLRKGGRWFAFADGQQDLFHADAALPDFLEVTHELRENFRNTRSIARFASGFGDLELDCVTGDGPPVRHVAAPADRVVVRTAEVARRLQRDERIADADLAVLWLFHNPHQGRTEEVVAAAMAGERVETNSAAFKGMERPVVVLGLDMDPDRQDRRGEVARAIYAAATRARSLLVVVGDPEAAAALGFEQLADDLRAAVG
jgi:hypothetical protein